MPSFFRYLGYVEFVVVCVIALAIIFVALHLVIWITTGKQAFIHARVVSTIKGMNEAWKICILILLPLFFRPVFKFLIHLKEGPWGTKSQEPARPQKQASMSEYPS